MARWLYKQEPDCYSYAQLEADGETVWDGVTNALALKHLRAANVGDEVFFYHTGDEKAVVGVMKITEAARPDPNAEKESHVIVTVKPVRKLANPVPLAAIKADPLFADWELVRISRLSVMPVSDAVWKRIEELARTPAEDAPKPGRKTKRAAG